MRLLYKGYVLLKGPIRGTDTFCCLGCVNLFHRSSGPDRQTHYDVLGVDRNASKDQIKQAYIELGKEFHPDKLRLTEDRKNLTKLQKVRKAEDDHLHFVKINLAYSVLSKPQSKKEYDLGLAGLKDPVTTGPSGPKGSSTRYYQPRTFDERAMHYGYKVDPNYKYDDSRYWVAAGCVVFAIVGYIIHYQIAYLAFETHRDFLDKRHVELLNEHKKTKEFSDSFESREANLDHMGKKLEEMQKKQKERLASYEAQPWMGVGTMFVKKDQDESDKK